MTNHSSFIQIKYITNFVYFSKPKKKTIKYTQMKKKGLV